MKAIITTSSRSNISRTRHDQKASDPGGIVELIKISVIDNMLSAKSAKSWPPSDECFHVGKGQLPEEIWQERNHRVKTDINNSRLELVNQFRQIISTQAS